MGSSSRESARYVYLLVDSWKVADEESNQIALKWVRDKQYSKALPMKLYTFDCVVVFLSVLASVRL